MTPYNEQVIFQGDPQSITNESLRISEESIKIERTIELPEPPYEEIKHLFSDKPLRFMQRPRMS